jgi:adenine-specific DNA-methyltransferase
MIYIDPPYNTGNDFIYPDNYSESLQTYLEYTRQVDDEGKRFSTNTETDGRFHSKWMSMMYPRLMLARNLLTEDGVIFISIDSNEFAHLQQLLAEVFGAQNELNTMVWVSNLKGRQISQLGPVATHEYVVLYARNAPTIEQFRGSSTALQELMPMVYRSASYSVKRDNKGEYVTKNELYNTNSKFNEVTAPTMVFKIHYHPKTGEVRVSDLDDSTRHPGFVTAMPHPNAKPKLKWHAWRWSKARILADHEDLEFEVDGEELRIRTKIRDIDGMAVKDLIIGPSTGTGQAEIERLGLAGAFDFPKPAALLQQLVSWSTSLDHIVLDFFAGSGTTGHAVLAQNAKDGGSRRFILVQLPEPVEEGSEAAKAEFETIADITKERVRRAAKEIAKEAGGASKLKLADGSGRQDLGFRVFKLDKSNFRVWDAAAPAGDEAKLAEQLRLQVEHVEKGRKGLDVVFEVLLKSKLPLTASVEKTRVSGGEVWSVESGRLLVVVDEGVDLAGVRELAKRTPKPETVVFLDRCFGGKDALKANASKIFQDAAIEFRTI